MGAAEQQQGAAPPLRGGQGDQNRGDHEYGQDRVFQLREKAEGQYRAQPQIGPVDTGALQRNRE